MRSSFFSRLFFFSLCLSFSLLTASVHVHTHIVRIKTNTIRKIQFINDRSIDLWEPFECNTLPRADLTDRAENNKQHRRSLCNHSFVSHAIQMMMDESRRWWHDDGLMVRFSSIISILHCQNVIFSLLTREHREDSICSGRLTFTPPYLQTFNSFLFAYTWFRVRWRVRRHPMNHRSNLITSASLSSANVANWHFYPPNFFQRFFHQNQWKSF